jgi:hypothetical protein
MNKDRKLYTLLTVSFVILITSVYLLWRGSYNVTDRSIDNTGDKPGILTIKAPDTASINQPISVYVEMDSGGENVNAAGIYLRYEPAMMQLLSMDTTTSFCQFYPEKRYDQNLGTITLACGSPHPGVNGKSVMMKLEFMPIRLGNTWIVTESNSQLLKSDGQGDTNILDGFPRADIAIQNTL